MKNIIAETKFQIQETIKNAISNLNQKFEINDEMMANALNTEIEIEIPKEKNHGDFSSNIAMKLTKILRK